MSWNRTWGVHVTCDLSIRYTIASYLAVHELPAPAQKHKTIMESSIDLGTNKKVALLGDRPYTAVYLFSQLMPLDDAIYYFSYSAKRATINHFWVDVSQSQKNF